MGQINPAVLVWYDDSDLASDCIEEQGFHCTVAKVRFLQEGEADGSLVAFARLLLAAKGIADDTRPSPAGFYLSSMTLEGNRWETSGPYPDMATAKNALSARLSP